MIRVHMNLDVREYTSVLGGESPTNVNILLQWMGGRQVTEVNTTMDSIMCCLIVYKTILGTGSWLGLKVRSQIL